MECDICGTKEGLVKVKNEDQETIYVCQSCYETQYEGYEASSDTDCAEDGEDDWEDDSASNEEDEDFDDDLNEEEEE